MLDKIFLTLRRIPYLEKKLWHGLYQYLARNYHAPDWTFMNYGFDGEGSRLELDAADEPNRACIQLYNYVAGAVPLRGLNVLEIGSGRGGGASFVVRYLKPARLTGLDLSEEAVRLCRRLHPIAGLTFQNGDAEQLPFEKDSFDAVINIESSHCYPHISDFFSEVTRVLRPGGHFLYADFRNRKVIDSWRRTLAASGLTIVVQADITANVVRALDVENERKLALMAREVPKILHRSFYDFAAVRGSKMYDGFRTGSLAYLAFVAQKRPSSVRANGTQPALSSAEESRTLR
jgi:ubiquinone/menaquinone biosynthesis C-methylase UbiE